MKRSSSYEVVIVGAGIYGLTLADHVSRWTSDVALIDSGGFSSGDNGSSGETRLFRRTTIEDINYAGFAEYGLRYFENLQASADSSLMEETGFAFVAEPGSLNQRHHSTNNIGMQAREIAQRLRVPHELLSTEQLNKMYPSLSLSSGGHVFLEPQACTLLVDRINREIFARLERSAVHVIQGRNALAIQDTDSGCTVTLEGGATLTGKAVVLATGSGSLGRHSRSRLTPQPQMWFDSDSPQTFPALVVTRPNSPLLFGFPDVAGGTGAKFVHENPVEDEREIGEIRHHPTPHERKLLSSMPASVGRIVPGLSPTARTTWTHYVNMPGSRMSVEVRSPHCLAINCCSGHGYKLAPGIAQSVSRCLRSGRLADATMA